MTERTTPAEQIRIMKAIVGLLDKVDPAAQQRIVGWMADCYPIDEEGEEAN